MWVVVGDCGCCGVCCRYIPEFIVPLSLWQHLLRYFQSSNLSSTNFGPDVFTLLSVYVYGLLGKKTRLKKDFGPNAGLDLAFSF